MDEKLMKAIESLLVEIEAMHSPGMSEFRDEEQEFVYGEFSNGCQNWDDMSYSVEWPNLKITAQAVRDAMRS